MQQKLSDRNTHNQDLSTLSISRQELPTLPVVNKFSRDRILGIIYGIALGDAIGLPVETLSAGQIKMRFGIIQDFIPVAHNTYYKDVSGIGVTSDDLRLTLSVADSLTKSKGFDISTLIKDHALELESDSRGWGSSSKSGVNNSVKYGPDWWNKIPLSSSPVGNGVAMKVAPLAIYTAKESINENELKEITTQFAQITHPTSIGVASGVAHLAAIRYCLSVTPDEFNPMDFLRSVVDATYYGEDLPFRFSSVEDGEHNVLSLRERLISLAVAQDLSRGEIVDKFNGGCPALYSLPFSYAFFLKNYGSIEALFEAVNAGGDTDSNGALVGALLGALHGTKIFPQELLSKIDLFTQIEPVVDRFCEFLGVDE